jgi:hypothetical protein
MSFSAIHGSPSRDTRVAGLSTASKSRWSARRGRATRGRRREADRARRRREADPARRRRSEVGRCLLRAADRHRGEAVPSLTGSGRSSKAKAHSRNDRGRQQLTPPPPLRRSGMGSRSQLLRYSRVISARAPRPQGGPGVSAAGHRHVSAWGPGAGHKARRRTGSEASGAASQSPTQTRLTSTAGCATCVCAATTCIQTCSHGSAQRCSLAPHRRRRWKGWMARHGSGCRGTLALI